MSTFFNNVLNTLIRNLPFAVRIIVSLCLLGVALWCFKKSLNKKGENFSAINWGWFLVFGVLFTLSLCYVTV